MPMEKIQIKTRKTKLLADIMTPVSVYFKLRDRFANTFLLESSDYHGSENSFSYICCSPLAFFKASGNEVITQLPDSPCETAKLEDLKNQLSIFANSFAYNEVNDSYIKSGLFGYINYNAVEHFEDIKLNSGSEEIPVAQYHLFQFIIALDHFKNECHLIESYIDESNDTLFEEVLSLIQQRNLAGYPFKTTGQKTSSKTDDEYLEMVQKGIHHCHIGDVFQVVLSRSFEIPFQGDEFQVYRALRSINPSPYLFFFDYGNYRLFGSSPEAQIVIKNQVATIHPIAGTFKRTGDDKADAQLASELLNDPKENSEHVMLVDLARNDLSRSCDMVGVETYKEIQYYSHVIHMVSKVSGEMNENTSFLDIVAETFPAGTLSGAPKIRAMQLIDKYEGESRGFYGGAIGFIDFQSNFNHAIMIRSFLSKSNKLKFRAGAGIVAKSKPKKELQEVYNKLGALEHAIKEAEKL